MSGNMGRMRRRFRLAGAALIGAVGLAGAADAAVRLTQPAGVGHFRLEEHEVGPEGDHGYRLSLDIETTAGGGQTAVIRSAEKSSNGVWKAVDMAPGCAAALHAPAGAVAAVTLSPPPKDMGSGFMDHCAPDAIYFPMEDVLNMSLAQNAASFRAPELRRAGDKLRFKAYSTAWTRAGTSAKVSSTGGVNELRSVKDGVATLVWTSDILQVDITNDIGNGQSVRLQGVEHFALELTIDARTGDLRGVTFPFDDLDMAVNAPGAPMGAAAPHLKIRRTVVMTREG
jgi:hypothetical protein